MLRKSLSLLLAFILLLSCVPCAAAATAGTYMVKEAQTNLYTSPALGGSFVAVLYKGSLLTVTDVSNGFGYVYRASLAAYGWVDLADCEKVNGEEFNTGNITGITVTPPDKLFYIDGEEIFDATGLYVWAVFSNGTRREVGGYDLYLPSFSSVGEKKVYVRYKPDGAATALQASFSVSVVPVPLNAMELGGTVKTQYIEGQTLSLEGLTATVSYLDGRQKRVFSYSQMLADDDFTFADCCGELQGGKLTVGEHQIKVTYKYGSFFTVLPITVREKQPASLRVETQPLFPYIYEDARTPDLTGLWLELTYDNGDTELVNGSLATVLFDAENAVLGANTVTLFYRGVQTDTQVEMLVPTLKRIAVTVPGKTVYMVGEAFDSNGLVVYGWFDSGASRPVNGWSVLVFDTSSVGTKTVQLGLGDCKTSYTVYVTRTGTLPGDADLDGTLTAADARLILRHAVALETLTGTALVTADRDTNGQIDADDARMTLRAAVGLEPVLPASTQIQ